MVNRCASLSVLRRYRLLAVLDSPPPANPPAIVFPVIRIASFPLFSSAFGLRGVFVVSDLSSFLCAAFSMNFLR
jgi:hypothetical protein